MIQITPQMRVLVAIEPVDGRKGIDSLAKLCQEKLLEDPFSGCVFVFRSRSGSAIRLLTYDGQGYWLLQKRLSKGRFRWWPIHLPNGWSPTRLSCCWQLAMWRAYVRRRCGGESMHQIRQLRAMSAFPYVPRMLAPYWRTEWRS
jgi:transposase